MTAETPSGSVCRSRSSRPGRPPRYGGGAHGASRRHRPRGLVLRQRGCGFRLGSGPLPSRAGQQREEFGESTNSPTRSVRTWAGPAGTPSPRTGSTRSLPRRAITSGSTSTPTVPPPALRCHDRARLPHVVPRLDAGLGGLRDRGALHGRELRSEQGAVPRPGPRQLTRARWCGPAVGGTCPGRTHQVASRVTIESRAEQSPPASSTPSRSSRESPSRRGSGGERAPARLPGHRGVPAVARGVVSVGDTDGNGHANVRSLYGYRSMPLTVSRSSRASTTTTAVWRGWAPFAAEHHLRFYAEMRAGDRYTVHPVWVGRTARAAHMAV